MAIEPARLSRAEMTAQMDANRISVLPDNENNEISAADVRAAMKFDADIRTEQSRRPVGAILGTYPNVASAVIPPATPTRLDDALWPNPGGFSELAMPLVTYADITADLVNGSLIVDEIPGLFDITMSVVLGFDGNDDCTICLYRDGVEVPGFCARGDGRGDNNEVPFALTAPVRSNAVGLTTYDLRATVTNGSDLHLFSYALAIEYQPLSKDLAIP